MLHIDYAATEKKTKFPRLSSHNSKTFQSWSRKEEMRRNRDDNSSSSGSGSHPEQARAKIANEREREGGTFTVSQ